MYFDMAFKDFTHLRWLSRNNSISGRTSFKTNTMFILCLQKTATENGDFFHPKWVFSCYSYLKGALVILRK